MNAMPTIPSPTTTTLFFSEPMSREIVSFFSPIVPMVLETPRREDLAKERTG